MEVSWRQRSAAQVTAFQWFLDKKNKQGEREPVFLWSLWRETSVDPVPQVMRALRPGRIKLLPASTLEREIDQWIRGHKNSRDEAPRGYIRINSMRWFTADSAEFEVWEGWSGYRTEFDGSAEFYKVQLQRVGGRWRVTHVEDLGGAG